MRTRMIWEQQEWYWTFSKTTADKLASLSAEPERSITCADVCHITFQIFQTSIMIQVVIMMGSTVSMNTQASQCISFSLNVPAKHDHWFGLKYCTLRCSSYACSKTSITADNTSPLPEFCRHPQSHAHWRLRCIWPSRSWMLLSNRVWRKYLSTRDVSGSTVAEWTSSQGWYISLVFSLKVSDVFNTFSLELS